MMRIARLAAALLAAGVAARGARAQAPAPEMLLGYRWVPYEMRFERIDPVTGSVSSYETMSNVAGGLIGLGCRAEHLDSISALNPGVDQFVRIHPADGEPTVIGPTGMTTINGILALDHDPTTGITYCTDGTKLYTIDPTTGQAQFSVNLTGFFPWDFLTALAIDRSGHAIGIGSVNNPGGNYVYDVDLTTGVVWYAGYVDVTVAGSGWFRDIAISRSGDILASYHDAGLDPGARGLYRLVKTSGYAGYVPHFLRHVPEPYFGLAFVPGTVQSAYCSPKTDSIGCVPAISGEGFPSGTASFGYAIACASVRNQVSGLLTFGISGRAALPFGGGTLCVAAPRRSSALQSSGGSPLPAADCSGEWSLDFNDWMHAHVALPSGVVVQCQWLGRDPGFAAPDNWILSAGLEFTLRP